MSQETYYEYRTTEDGRTVAINTRTGEVHKAVNLLTPEGSHVLTPEDQQRNRERKEQREQNQRRRNASNEFGDFYFIKGEQEFPELSPQTLARLIYLETYIGYANQTNKSRNKLMKTQKTQMRREDLPEVLKVSRSLADEFWNEVSPKYVTADDEGLLYSNSEVFIRGALKRKEYTAYQKFYRDGIQSVYLSLKPSKHRYLGYVYQMLRFVNFEFNVLCFNPDETNKDRIEPMTVRQFCEEIGFNVSNWCRLENVYRNLRFKVGDNLEKFCAFVTDGGNKADMRIIVNPRIIYGGTDYQKVGALDIIFR